MRAGKRSRLSFFRFAGWSGEDAQTLANIHWSSTGRQRVLAAMIGGALTLAQSQSLANAAPYLSDTAQIGLASYYVHGSETASGERFDPTGFTAAHRTLKFGTRVRVILIKTGRSVVVRINDRGPFVYGRIIDLAFGAAMMIGLDRSGIANVRIRILQPQQTAAGGPI